jgi:hypothetical protein
MTKSKTKKHLEALEHPKQKCHFEADSERSEVRLPANLFFINLNPFRHTYFAAKFSQ